MSQRDTGMKFLSRIARRIAAVALPILGAASAAGLIAATAVSSPGTALAADAAPASPVPACTAGDLGAWVAITQGNGAAGSIYYPLQFTNLSGHACAMRGFPGVSAVDRNGHQLGSPARWGHAVPVRTVVLAPGATAHTTLQYSDAEVTTAPGCYPVFSAFELRVYPPGQYGATYAAFGLEACSHAGPVYMSVGPILPGVGTVYG
jgi:Protein of unknown function (DUF4232)